MQKKKKIPKIFLHIKHFTFENILIQNKQSINSVKNKKKVGGKKSNLELCLGLLLKVGDRDLISPYLYLYISKSWSILFIITTLLLSHISGHIIHQFSTFSLLFLTLFFHINFPTYCYTFSNFSPSFYLFISPLLSTLISLFLYPFIFLYFWLFLFPYSYYKFTILSLILYIVFLHTKCSFSLSLSKLCFSVFGGLF